MRISWGYKILALYLSFVAGILFLVFKASKENYDLVTKNYYEAELKYQEVIDRKANTARLSGPVRIENSKTKIRVEFPADFNDKAIKGDAYLYCPSDARKDIRRPIDSKDLAFEWILPGTPSGLYELKLSWVSDGVEYYKEEKVFF